LVGSKSLSLANLLAATIDKVVVAEILEAFERNAVHTVT
jgi:hypothetical protein